MRDEKVLKIAFLFQVASFWNTWDSLYRACHEDDNCETRFFLIEGSDEENAQMAGAESFLREKYIFFKIEKSMMLLMACGKCGKKKCLSLAHFVFHKRAMLFHRFINRLLPPPF